MNLESGPAVALAEGCVFSLLLIFAPSDLGWREEVREKQSGHYSAHLRRQLASRCDVTASQPDVAKNRANQPGFLRAVKTTSHGFSRIRTDRMSSCHSKLLGLLRRNVQNQLTAEPDPSCKK